MKVSDYLVTFLEREGVEHVFNLLGEEMEALLFSLRDLDVTFAESFGINGYRPRTATAVPDAFDDAIGSGMSLIEGQIE